MGWEDSGGVWGSSNGREARKRKDKKSMCLKAGLQFSVYIYNTRTEMFICGIGQ